MVGRLAAAVLLLACAPALAQKAPSDGPPNLFDVPEDQIESVQADGIPDGDIVRLGDLAILLGESPLNDIMATVGGRVVHAGDAASSVSSICFHIDGADADTRLWLTAGEISGGSIDGVTLARLPAATTTTAGCPALKPTYTPIHLPGDLKPGEPDGALHTRLGRASYDKNGVIGFQRTLDLGVPQSRGGPCDLSQWVWAKVEREAVAAVSIKRISVC